MSSITNSSKRDLFLKCGAHFYRWSIENQTAISQLACPIIEVKFDDGITTIHGNGAAMRAIVLFVTPPEQNRTIKY